MKRIFTICAVLCCTYFSITAQSLADLQAMKAEKEAVLAEKQAELDAISGEVAGLSDQITKLSGWTKGMNAVAGFNLNKANNWAKNANTNGQTSSLAISGSAFANKITEKAFWRNNAILNLGWQKIDPNTLVDGDETGFDRNVDLLNISSLAGYRLTDSWALTGLGDVNTSIGSFLSPGTVDLGFGGTFTGIDNLVLVVHPLNGRIAFPAGATGLDTKAFLGLKIRADYNKQFSNGIGWSTNATIFNPYSGEFVLDGGASISAFEWTWLNTITVPVWNGVGLGFSFGLRDAAFEYDGVQSFYTVGLSYSL